MAISPRSVRPIETIGIVGCGRMGLAICAHLIANGWPVVVTDASPDAQERAAAVGARPARLEELAAAADLVLVIVVDDEQVASVTEALADDVREGTVIAICASVKPGTCQAAADVGAASGAHVIDVALVRGERGAEQGGLALFCGGDEHVVDACGRAFAAFATDVCHLGPIGAGQIAKTANNILLWACLRADVEALRLARALGLEPSRLRPALAVGSGANKPLAEWGLHRLRWPAKDLEVALELAREADVDLPLVAELPALMAELSVDDLRELK